MERISRERCDLVIAGIRKPGNRNLEFVEEWRIRRRDLPVIRITGCPTPETASQSIELSVAACLLKPFDMDDLVHHIETGLERSRLSATIKTMQDRLHRRDAELETMLSSAAKAQKGEFSMPLEAFQMLTYRNIVESIEDLYRIGRRADGSAEAGSACHLLKCPRPEGLLQVIGDAADVPESTKTSFRSDRLGRLKKKLERVMRENI